MEDYEITMYLNMSHIEVLDEYCNSVDLFEKYRSILSGYIIEDSINGAISTQKMLGVDFQTFELSETYWRILMESAITKSNQDGIVIKPIKHDEFKRYYKNPHRRPNGLKA